MLALRLLSPADGVVLARACCAVVDLPVGVRDRLDLARDEMDVNESSSSSSEDESSDWDESSEHEDADGSSELNDEDDNWRCLRFRKNRVGGGWVDVTG